MGKNVRAVGLSACYNYFLKKKKKKVYNVAPSTLTTMSIYIIYVVKVLVAIITSAWPAQCAGLFYLLFMEKYVKS